MKPDVESTFGKSMSETCGDYIEPKPMHNKQAHMHATIASCIRHSIIEQFPTSQCVFIQSCDPRGCKFRILGELSVHDLHFQFDVQPCQSSNQIHLVVQSLAYDTATCTYNKMYCGVLLISNSQYTAALAHRSRV
mgnify:FL=1